MLLLGRAGHSKDRPQARQARPECSQPTVDPLLCQPVQVQLNVEELGLGCWRGVLRFRLILDFLTPESVPSAL